MIGRVLHQAIEATISDYSTSRLSRLVREGGPYAIKFVASKWATRYTSPARLKISDKPALTWGTATYVTPLAFPLSSALYGRVGLVTSFDPTGWRVFDATQPAARAAYVRWASAQPAFSDLVLTVHSTHANHTLRNKFREDFRIDCVLFHPDQEAEFHTDRGEHVWMAVTDWTRSGRIDANMSARLSQARFTVLLDEDFSLEENGLPIQKALRQIESVTAALPHHRPIMVDSARTDPTLPATVATCYSSGEYLHVFIEP